MPTVEQLATGIEKLAPLEWAEEWDNCGLLAGSLQAEVARVFVCLDLDNAILAQASAKNCSLIISHHPPLFQPVKKIISHDVTTNLIIKALHAGINLYAAHTNFDKADCGHAAHLAEMLGLKGITPLASDNDEAYVKIVVFVPASHLDAVFQGLAECGAGSIGAYEDCSFRASGQGTFRPLENADPYIGKIGQLEGTDEVRLEMILPFPQTGAAVAAIKRTHPYEAPAFDLYPLLNHDDSYGFGRIGTLKKELDCTRIVAILKDRLTLTEVRCSSAPGGLIKKIAVVPGSGSSMIAEAAAQGADIMITGDLKYHDYQKGANLGITLLDIGHYSSEFPFVDCMSKILEDNWATEIEVIKQRKPDGKPYKSA